MVGPGKPGKHMVSAGTEAGGAGDSDHAVGAGAPGEAGCVCVCVCVCMCVCVGDGCAKRGEDVHDWCVRMEGPGGPLGP